MASKIQSHNFYVAITPYKVQGVEDQFNELCVTTGYTQYQHQFYVSLHAGWMSTFGSHGSIIMGDQNPLTAATWVYVKESPKNSQKTINEMGAALELAKADIAWLFDERMFTQLQQFVKDVALYGYNAMLEERIRSYKNERTVTAQVNAANNSNNQTSEDKTMAQNVKAADLIGKKIVVGDNQATIVIKSMDGDKLSGEFTKDGKTTPMSFPVSQLQGMTEKGLLKISDANEPSAVSPQTSEVTTDVDVAEVDDIVPVVTAKPKAKPAEKPAVTMPMGKHGTLVIAGVGGTKEEPKANSQKPEAKVQDSVPQVRLVVYTTRHGDQAPRIDGFGGEDDPRWKRHYDEKLRLKKAAKEADKKNEKLKARMKGKSKEERAELLKQWVSVGSDPFNATVRTDFATDNKSYFFLMGAKYMAVAQQLVDAYNSGDAAAIAAAEQAVMDVKNGIVAERQAAREERMAAKPKPAGEPAGTVAATGEKQYTLDEVAAMLGKLLPDGAAKVDDIKKLLKAA